MAILRIYVDTSVFGGVFDAEFQSASIQFFYLINAGVYDLVISDIVLGELRNAPEHVREVVDSVLPLATVIQASSEGEDLRDSYLEEGILSHKHKVDALHVAMASISGCFAIVSWNFRHIVNARLIPLFNAANVLRGYNQIGIYTPHGVLGNDD